MSNVQSVGWGKAGEDAERESSRGSGDNNLLVLEDGESVSFAILSPEPVKWFQKWQGKGQPAEMADEDDREGRPRYAVHVALVKSSRDGRLKDGKPTRYLWAMSPTEMKRLSRRIQNGAHPRKVFFSMLRSGTGLDTEYDLDPSADIDQKQGQYLANMAGECPDLAQDVQDTLFAPRKKKSGGNEASWGGGDASEDKFSDDEIPF